MNKTIIWEDLNIQTDLETGMIEEISSDPEVTVMDKEMASEDQFFHSQIEEIIMSPFGMYHVKDFFNPMRQYNWHMGHTNFNITQDVSDKLEEIEGIERLQIVSRYRFIMAIGKVFNPDNVKNSIYKVLDASPMLSGEAEHKMEEIKGIYDKWCIHFISNEEWEYTTEADEDFESKVKSYIENQKKNGGILINHETKI